MSNNSSRDFSPSLAQRNIKRRRLDATSPLYRCSSSPPNSRRMIDDQNGFKREASLRPADSPVHTTDDIVRQRWPSSCALAPDPVVLGSSGQYFGGDYLAATRTTSVPIEVSASKRPLSRSSLSTLGSSGSKVPSLYPTPFSSVSPVAAFSSDTSAATHHSSTTSVDEAHNVFPSQIARRPGGAVEIGFQLMPHHSERRAEVTQPEATHDPSIRPPLERSAQATDNKDSYIGLPRYVGGPNSFAPLPLLSFHSETPGLDSMMALPESLTSVSTPSASGTKGSSSPSQASVLEPILLSPLNTSSSSHVDVGAPSQLVDTINPFASPLARDALLSQAYRVYESPSSLLPSGLSPTPVDSPIRDPISPTHAYTAQLVPLLTALRTLHPHHLPTLLLLACVLYALGDFNGSLTLNCEILHIDPNYVCRPSHCGYGSFCGSHLILRSRPCPILGRP